GAGPNIEFANGHAKALWGTEGFRIVSKRVLSFRHTYRYFVFAGVFELLELFFSRRGEVHALAAIDIGDDMLDALTNAGIGSEHGLNGVVPLIEHSAKFRSKRFGTFAAVSPDANHFGLNTAGLTKVFDPLQFVVGVLWELVDRYDDGCTKGLHVLEVTSQVLGAFFHRLDVAGTVIAWLIDLIQGQATVVFYGAHRGDHGHGVGGKSAGRAGDIHEFLGTQIRTEAGFGDDGIGQIKSGVGSNHRVRTVGDIGEWTTVNQRRCPTDRLDKVWFHGIAQQNRHATLCTIWSKFSGGYWFPVIGFRN